MKYLLLLGLSVSAFGQSFNGVTYDGERVRYFSGSIFQPRMTRHEEIMEGFRISREQRERIKLISEMEEQTRLLREIANQ